MNHGLLLQGRFTLALRDRRGRTIWVDDCANGITSEGLTHALSVILGGGSQNASWYASLIDSAGFEALSQSDVMASHAGWAENSLYQGSGRVALATLTAANALLLNTSPMAFVLTADVSARGVFITSGSAKGGTSGVLWCTALFPTIRVMRAGQTLNVTYRLRAGGGS